MRLRRLSLVAPLILAATACQGAPPLAVTGPVTAAPVEVTANTGGNPADPAPAPATGSVLAGVVTLETGPLAEADVTLTVVGTPGAKATGKTDAAGRYSLTLPAEGAPAGGFVIVTATRDGRTAAALAIAGAPIAVNLTAGTTLAMVILRDRLEAVGQAYYLNGLPMAPVVQAVFEAYGRFVASLEVALLKLSSADQARVWRGIQTDGHGAIDRDLADALLAAHPPLGTVFVATADEVKAAILAAVAQGGRRPDAGLLGGLTFGSLGTSTIRFGSSSGGGAAGGPAAVVPLDPTEGATVIDGSAN